MNRRNRSFVAPLICGFVAIGFPLGSEARNAPRGPDFDCDGLDDMAIGVPGDSEIVTGGGGVNILYGTSSGPDAPSMTTLRFDQDSPAAVEGVAELGDHFGGALAYGDFDQDGYDDLAIGAAGEDVGAVNAAGAINVLYGGSGGLSEASDQIWHGDSTGITLLDPASEQLGIVLAAGDFDGDGYDDLAASANAYDGGSVSNSGGVLILYGGSGGLSSSGHQMLHQGTAGMAGDGNQASDYWGSSLVTGDFDCDGFEDLAIGANDEEHSGVTGTSHGAVTVVYGSSGGLTTAGSQWWHQGVGNIEGEVEIGDNFGNWLAAGNFDGDSSGGIDCVDLAIGAFIETVDGVSANGAVNIIYGGTSGLTDVGDQILYQGNGLAGTLADDNEIGSILTVGRFNNDAYDDLAVGANEADPGGLAEAGEIYLAKGSSSGLTSSGAVRWDAATANVPGTREANDGWSWGLSYAAFEGDGGEHYLVVGAYNEDSSKGAVTTIELNSSTSSLAPLGGTEWFQDDIDGTVDFSDNFGFSMPAPRLKGRCLM